MSPRSIALLLVAVLGPTSPAVAADQAAAPRADVQRIEDAILGRASGQANRGRPESTRPPVRPEVERQTLPRPDVTRTDEPVVHLLAVADSNDPQIGAKVGEDARHVADLFEESFAQAGKRGRLRTRVVVGDDVTARGVLAAVRGLAVRPQDTVVVYFSGHGTVDGRDRHTLGLGSRDRLSGAAVLEAVAAHGPRLVVLLTDMCSNFSDRRSGEPVVTPGAARDLPRGRVIAWATVEHLFLAHRGVVDLTAAEPGFPAGVERWGRGSYFTNALLQLLTTPHPALVAGLDRNGDRAVQWSEVLPQLRAAAAARSRADRRPGESAERPQQAYARSLGVWAPTTGVALAP